MKKVVGLLAAIMVSPAGALEFEKDVLPILESNCFKCHKDGKEKGDLNLEPHKIKEYIGAGRMIQPGKPTGGLFMKVILSKDPDTKMPPKGPGLSEREIQTLRLWITQGADLGALEPDPNAPPPLEAVWTNKAGKKIEATLMKVEEDKAVLKMKKDGKIYRYPIANLSEESQTKIKEWAEKGG